MNESIILPFTYEPAKLNKKTRKWTQKFTKKTNEDNIIEWEGLDAVHNLYFIYLLHKYNKNCLLKYTDDNYTDKDHIEYSLGLFINANSKSISDLEAEVFKSISSSLAICILNNEKLIMIPLILSYKKESHANLLIYRTDENKLEHFEPNGNVMLREISDVITKKMMYFIELLTHKIRRESIDFVPATKICPRIGLQALESSMKHKTLANGKPESEGYCVAWSIFFTELCLMNPTISSEVLLDSVFESSKSDPEYLKKLIRGYILHISEKLDKYFTFLFKKIINDPDSSICKYGICLNRLFGLREENNFDETINVENFSRKIIPTESSRQNKFYNALSALTNVETMRLYPDKTNYKKILKNDISRLTNQIKSSKNRNELERLNQLLLIKKYEKKILKNMHLLENIGKSKSTSLSSSMDNPIITSTSNIDVQFPEHEVDNTLFTKRITRRRRKVIPRKSSTKNSNNSNKSPLHVHSEPIRKNSDNLIRKKSKTNKSI
jgi:hypothetical protein